MTSDEIGIIILLVLIAVLFSGSGSRRGGITVKKTSTTGKPRCAPPLGQRVRKSKHS